MRNLLLVATIQTGLVIERLAAGSEEQRALASVLRAHEQASALLRDAMRSETRPRSAAASDLEALVKRIEPLLRAVIAPRRLRVHAPRGPIRAAVAAEDAERTILNLVLNAREATRCDGMIQVEVARLRMFPAESEETPRPAGRCVAITVRDDGCGLGAGDAARIFEPGFTTRAAGGGLGLSAVREVVERCGGRITLESERGHGSAFRLFFPCAPRAAARASAARSGWPRR